MKVDTIVSGERAQMTPRRRAELFAVIGDVKTEEMLHIAFEIHKLVSADRILKWLIRRDVTGQRLIDFVRSRENSVHRALAEAELNSRPGASRRRRPAGTHHNFF